MVIRNIELSDEEIKLAIEKYLNDHVFVKRIFVTKVTVTHNLSDSFMIKTEFDLAEYQEGDMK